jgi:hypothetical protein
MITITMLIMTSLITTLLIMTIIIILDTGDIAYNLIYLKLNLLINGFTYN